MTKNSLHILIFALALLMSSCSLFKGVNNVFTGDQGKESAQVQEETVLADATSEESPSATVPTYAPAPKPEKKQPAASNMSSTASFLEGEWIIVHAGKYKIAVDEEMPYINFDFKNNRFYASNGCNILNGDFKLVNNKEIAFSSVLSTSMACPDVPFQGSIADVLKDGSKVQLKAETKGQESYLELYKAGSKVMTLRRTNMDKLNGKWLVAMIGEEKIENESVNVFFDIPELLVHGNTGCNYFNGVILVDPAIANSISFAQMGVTMRLCENSDIERAMLVALEEVASYHVKSNNVIQLKDSDGKTLMTLKRE